MSERRPLEEEVTTVAEHTLELDFEEYIQGERPMALRGLLATDEPRFVNEVEGYVDRAVRSQASNGQLAYGSIDHVPEWADGDSRVWRPVTDPGAMGSLALEIYENGGPDSYLEACERQLAYLLETADRTADGGITQHAHGVELWVDALYMMCPFMARYGALTGENGAIDAALEQIDVHAKHLQDPHTGLFRHSWSERPNDYPDGTLWLRGNGWAATGILDTLQYVPEDHPSWQRAADVFTELSATMLDVQDDSGFWHHLVDDPTTYLETSGTLQFAYAFDRGIRRGLLDDEYAEAAGDAMGAARTAVTNDGAVKRNAAMPGGPAAPQDVNLYGQGWFLIAANSLLEPGGPTALD